MPLLLASSCLLAEARSVPGTVASSSGTVQLCSKNQTITRSPTPWPSRRKAAETSLPALDLWRNQPVFSTTRKFIIQHYSFFFFFFFPCLHALCLSNKQVSSLSSKKFLLNLWRKVDKTYRSLEDTFISGLFLLFLSQTETDWQSDFIFYSAIKTVFRMKTGLLYSSNAITFLSPYILLSTEEKNNDDFGQGVLKE